MKRTRLLVLVAVLSFWGTTLAAASQTPAGVSRGQGAAHSHRPVCGPPAKGRAHCHAEVVTEADAVTPLATTSPSAGAYRPADLQSAYSLPSSTAGVGQVVAIVDAYDNPNAASDLAAYRSQWGLPPCTVATGCFQKVNQSGATSPLPSANTGWGQEIDLDLQMVSAVCPNCRIVLVEANSSYLSDLFVAVDTAANVFHANAISNSYGGSEYSGEQTGQSHYNHPGSAITASSGDSGYGVEFPAASAYVTAVGGTSLTHSSTSRGWSETAWSSAGSGCSAYIAKPSWQTDSGCSRRTVADVSAVADPSTGVAVYDSYGSSGGANWYVFGGTSVAAPIIAATYALGGATGSLTYGSSPYSHTSSLFDVVSGHNGSCSPIYLCTAQAGFDGPTGLGTPNSTGAFGGSTPTTTTSTTTAPTTTTSTTSAPPSTTSTTSTTTTTTTTTSTTTTAPASSQIVVNPGFETGTFGGWAIGGGAPTPAISTAVRHSGSYAGLFGTGSGAEPRGNSWAYQNVSIPSSVSKATLKFWYWPATNDTVSYDWQEAQIRTASGSKLAQVFKTASNAKTWTSISYDVTAYKGTTIQLWFNVHQDGAGDQTSMYLDDVTVTTS